MEFFKKSSSSQPRLVRFKMSSTITMSPKTATKNIQHGFSTTSNTAENVHFATIGFPEPLLYYLKTNANPSMLLRLMKSSRRYFSFKEFPFFVIHFIKITKSSWTYYDRKTDSIQTLDLANLTKPLWISKGIDCNTLEPQAVISKLLSKTFICDVKSVRVVGRILCSTQLEFMNCKENIESFTLINSHVECCLCSLVSMDKIMRCLPNVKKFLWLFSRAMASTITHKATKDLIDSINPSILQSFSLMNVPETFDFKLFSKFMKQNPSIEFFLEFDNISLKFSKMLQKYVNKLIKNAPVKYQPIRIRFPNQTDASRESLDTLYQLHAKQIV